MADEIVEQIGKDPNFIKSIKPEYDKMNSMALVNRAEVGNKLFVKFKQYESAIQIAGETIYEQCLEIDELRNQIISYGDYNENEINTKVQFRKLNTNNENKNKIIRDRLLQIISRSRALIEK